MGDLDDYILFAGVVDHGGFSAAGRVLGLPKSRLSRRIAALEERLGVRLIERSTRRFRVTDVGQTLYEHCRIIALELERAHAITADAVSEPRGQVRFSCPHGLVEPLAAGLTDYLLRFPKVSLHIVATDRAVDLIGERIDVALRVRTTLESDPALTIRILTRSRRILVTSPAVAAAMGKGVASLAAQATLSSAEKPGPVTWKLLGPGEASFDFTHEPRMRCENFAALTAAATAGLGVALLPDHVCKTDLEAGRLMNVLPDWHTQEGIVHLIFTTRRGLPPAVRCLIDHLAELFRDGGPLAANAGP